MELGMDCLTSRQLLQKIRATNVSSAPKYEHRPRLVSQDSSSYDGWAKCKEKLPDVSDSNENVEATCNSKLKLT